MNINDIMLRDMAEAKKRAEIEEAEREARAYRRAEKFTHVCCALLSVLAVATLLLIAVALYWDKAHKRAVMGETPAAAQNQTNAPAEATAPAAK